MKRERKKELMKRKTQGHAAIQNDTNVVTNGRGKWYRDLYSAV